MIEETFISFRFERREQQDARQTEERRAAADAR